MDGRGLCDQVRAIAAVPNVSISVVSLTTLHRKPEVFSYFSIKIGENDEFLRNASSLLYHKVFAIIQLPFKNYTSNPSSLLHQ